MPTQNHQGPVHYRRGSDPGERAETGRVVNHWDRRDIEAMFAIVRTHLRGPAPDDAAYQLAHRLEELLTAGTSDSGSASAPLRDNEFDGWVTTTEAAKLLHTSERWVRELAPAIGGRKQYGRWLIPRSALPEED